MFEYHESMDNTSEPAARGSAARDAARDAASGGDRGADRSAVRGTLKDPALAGNGQTGPGGPGVLKAMSPGVVDFLFRQLVSGGPAEDVQWHKEGTALAVQPPGAELARRLAETDLDALTPTEVFHYVRAAQRLAGWAEGLREAAVARYCSAPSAEDSPSASSA